MCRRTKRRVEAGRLRTRLKEHVIGCSLVQRRRAGCGGLLGRGDHRQGIVLDADQFSGVLGDIPILRENHGDDFARKPHSVDAHRIAFDHLDARQGQVGTKRLCQRTHLRAAQRVRDPGEGARRRRIDRYDPRMGVGTTHEEKVQRSGRLGQIIEVRAQTPQQPVVLAPQRRVADVTAARSSGCRRRTQSAFLRCAPSGGLSRSSRAAESTAATIFT